MDLVPKRGTLPRREFLSDLIRVKRVYQDCSHENCLVLNQNREPDGVEMNDHPQRVYLGLPELYFPT